MNNNTASVRVNANEILFCLQSLYQNKVITASERVELSTLLKALLSDEEDYEKRQNFFNAFQNAFYSKDIPSAIRQNMYQLLRVLKD